MLPIQHYEPDVIQFYPHKISSKRPHVSLINVLQVLTRGYHVKNFLLIDTYAKISATSSLSSGKSLFAHGLGDEKMEIGIIIGLVLGLLPTLIVIGDLKKKRDAADRRSAELEDERDDANWRNTQLESERDAANQHSAGLESERDAANQHIVELDNQLEPTQHRT